MIMVYLLLLKNLIIYHQKILFRLLANKNDIANFVKKTDFDNKLKDITSNKNEMNYQEKLEQFQQKD